jgi:hypothetical protein
MKQRLMRLKVKPKDLLLGAGIGIVLAMVATVIRLGPQGVMASVPFTFQDIVASVPTPNAPLNAKSTPREVAALMLNSHTKWASLSAQMVTLYTGGAITTTIVMQQSGQIHITTVPLNPDVISDEWISDGVTQWEINHTRRVYTQSPVPEEVRPLNIDKYNPPAPPGDGENFVIPHPMAFFLPYALGDYIYPHGLAQSVMQWKSSVEGTDIISGREAVIILLRAIDDKGVLMKKHKHWIDSQTGLVLRTEVYLEYDWDKWVEQTTFTSIKYNVPLAAQAFAFQPVPELKLVPTLLICPECFDPTWGTDTP